MPIMPVNGIGLQEALRALMAQRPPDDEDVVMPELPPSPNLRAPGPRPPEMPPSFGSLRPNIVRGDDLPESPFSGVSRQNAMQGLAGLQAAQGNQFSPFGEMELTRLASRDPNTVAPGSNAMWAAKLKEAQEGRRFSEGLQRRALEGISGAIASTHPAIQFGAEQEARRKAMPAMVTAQGQFRAAEEAANSRRDVGEAQLEGRVRMAQSDRINAVMDAIRAIRAKQGGLQGTDREQLRALENLYDILSEDVTGASFGEAYEGIER